ncbi:MAG TPA: hypothetical protein VGR35_12305 [Tepidisphaeraceae bacterium]|nr:hypothetical protein [Tepidisphaeraceae bacterium]
MGPGRSIEAERKPGRTQLVVLGGLSVVAAAVLIRLLSSGPQSAPAATVGTTPLLPNAAVVSSQAAPQPANGAVSVTWPTAVARDPFQSDLVFPPAPPLPPAKVEPTAVAPPATSSPQVSLAALAKEKIHLKATVLGDRPLAMMNGRVYRVGEVIEGFLIVEIEKNQITIERNDLRLVITVQ